jgi:hypothetical protein
MIRWREGACRCIVEGKGHRLVLYEIRYLYTTLSFWINKFEINSDVYFCFFFLEKPIVSVYQEILQSLEILPVIRWLGTTIFTYKKTVAMIVLEEI